MRLGLAACVLVVQRSSVYPSAGERFTSIVPITPLAPGLFSTTAGCLAVASIYCAQRRAEMSPEPPGPKGTMIRIGRFGQLSSARAGAAKAVPVPSPMRASCLRVIVVSFMMFPPSLDQVPVKRGARFSTK